MSERETSKSSGMPAGVPVPERALREVFYSLRFRLTFWNSVVFWIAIILVLAGVRISMRIALNHEADSQLLEDAEEIRLLISDLYPEESQIKDELRIKTQTHKHRDLFIQLRTLKGEVVWESDGTPRIEFPPPVDDPRKAQFRSGEWHIVHRRIPKESKAHDWSIVIGATLRSVENEVQQLTQTILAVGAFAFLITPLGGYWLAGRATRPLTEIMDTTSRLHPANLDERLPLRGTRDELDRLSATINGFLDRIAGFLERNREFTAHAAHELRSPLAAIQSSIEVALTTDRDPEQYKEMLAEILDECASLTKLVNQLLVLAETDAGIETVKKQDLNLQQLVQRSCEMFRGAAEVKGVNLVTDSPEPVWIQGDPQRLRQVINNLIDNALKFTPEGKIVRVELRSGNNGYPAVLRVKDQGMGIPANELAHIFERFYTVDRSRSRGTGSHGSGLGLSICQSIVTAHSGKIEVTSEVGKGTTFEVTLPKTIPD